MEITQTIKYLGVNDHKIDLFEGQYQVKNGMAYNSYMILDDKIAVLDSVDRNFTHEWLDNIAANLKGRKPDYFICLHMEPDHSANIKNFIDFIKLLHCEILFKFLMIFTGGIFTCHS